MAEQLTVTVENRERVGKGSYRLRANGSVPGVVYGPTLKTPLNVSVVRKDLTKLYQTAGKTQFVDLQGPGAGALAGTKIRIKSVQVDHMRNEITHVDFHMPDLNRPIRTRIPLRFTGKAKGVAEGGILQVLVRDVEVKCLPLDTPEFIEADISNVGLDESLKLSDLDNLYKGGKYQFIYTTDIALAGVVIPREETLTPQVAAPADATNAAAPAGAAAAPAAGAAAAPAAGAAAAAPAKDGAKK